MELFIVLVFIVIAVVVKANNQKVKMTKENNGIPGVPPAPASTFPGGGRRFGNSDQAPRFEQVSFVSMEDKNNGEPRIKTSGSAVSEAPAIKPQGARALKRSVAQRDQAQQETSDSAYAIKSRDRQFSSKALSSESLRQMIIAKEFLDKPVSKRPRNGYGAAR